MLRNQPDPRWGERCDLPSLRYFQSRPLVGGANLTFARSTSFLDAKQPKTSFVRSSTPSEAGSTTTFDLAKLAT